MTIGGICDSQLCAPEIRRASLLTNPTAATCDPLTDAAATVSGAAAGDDAQAAGELPAADARGRWTTEVTPPALSAGPPLLAKCGGSSSRTPGDANHHVNEPPASRHETRAPRPGARARACVCDAHTAGTLGEKNKHTF